MPGEVRLNENNVAHIVPRFAGVVTEVRKNLGDPVEKGEVMAVIESNDSLVPYELKSLIKGTVIQKHITLGEVRDLSTDAFIVADLSTVWVDMNIYQKDIGRIREGQTARIIAPHDLGTATNKISYVGPSVSESTRTGLARVVLPNPDRKWLPGLFITGHVVVESKEYPLVVPLTAIQKVEGTEVVFVKDGDEFKPVPVKLGARNATHAEVLAGLDARTDLRGRELVRSQGGNGKRFVRRGTSSLTKHHGKLIQFCLRSRLLVVSLGVLVLAAGYYSYTKLPVDAFPDVSPALVQVFVETEGLAPEEVEKYVTYPVEVAMNGIAEPQGDSLRFELRPVGGEHLFRRRHRHLLRPPVGQ